MRGRRTAYFAAAVQSDGEIEVMPADAVQWSDGKALISVGIPVPPVSYKSVNYHIWASQQRHALSGPGLGRYRFWRERSYRWYAACRCRSRSITSEPARYRRIPAAPVDNLRASSATVAVAVAKQAVKDGVATKQPENWVQAVQDVMWQPVYR